MDRSFHSPMLGPKSPFSPMSRQHLNMRKSLAQPSFRKSSRLSISGKSTQSVQIILKSQYNYVERFGQPLPVLVTEALTFADRNTQVSARISECGYAWIVCGRRLLIWQYKQSPALPGTPQKKNVLTTQCFELQLPQSDLAHRAELVSVFVMNKSHSPSCITVSPEGVLRYWPAVAHESVFVEQTVELHGEECDSLTDIRDLGCILATTSCTIVLVQPHVVTGRNTLNCKTLKTPSGWLGGLSKRISFIFGPITTDNTAETRIVRVLPVPNKDGTWMVYVLAGHSLQKWKLSSQEPEQLIFVAELSRLVRDSFQATVWENCVGDQNDIDTWLLDIQPDKDNVILLAAAVNMHVSPQVYYAMMCVQTNTIQPPTNIKDFYLLKLSGLYRDDNPSDSLSYRFLLSSAYAYLYNQKTITVIKPQEEPDTLEFNSSSQDRLLGGSVCVNTPIFFSKTHGLIAVSSNEMADLTLGPDTPHNSTSFDVSVNESVIANNLSVYNIDPQEISVAYKDTLSQMKAAFIFHIKNQQAAYQEILQQLFPLEPGAKPSIDSALDTTVVSMCQNLLDDVPAEDPRWTRGGQPGIGSSYSMQILHQLEDKQKALMLFIKFLVDSGLQYRLSACTIRDVVMATTHIIGEFSEKIVAAITLRSLPSSAILETAVSKAADESSIELENGLTYQDIFYREVSKIYRGLQQIINNCEDNAHSDMNPTEIAQHIYDSNEIILAVLKEVVQYRQMKAEMFTPADFVSELHPDYLPWTTAGGTEGLGDSLLLQHNLTYNYGIKLVSQSQQRNSLCDQLLALADVILDGRKCHLESIRNTTREGILRKQYAADRQTLIKPLLQEKEFEKAAQLAEKYLDFDALIYICELTDNQPRLDEYIERFSYAGFSEHVYNWFMRENKQGKLIDRCRKLGKSKNAKELVQFLKSHPSLSWIQEIFDDNFSGAANTLRKLALEETESITRQKTEYSLAKLAKLAESENNKDSLYVENVNTQLELIALQEDIPDYVLQCYGYDITAPRVMPPSDLGNLYICPEFKDATELEFKKALDILNYITDEELKDQLWLKIWRTAILRDSWNFQNLDSPLDLLQNTLFFRLVDLAVILGANVQTLLPPIELLMDDASMNELNENKSFQYLLKTGYEHVLNQQSP